MSFISQTGFVVKCESLKSDKVEVVGRDNLPSNFVLKIGLTIIVLSFKFVINYIFCQHRNLKIQSHVST